MSTITSLAMRNKDLANTIEITLFNKITYSNSGAYIDVEGSDFKYLDAPILNIGYSFNLPEKSNCEVLLLGDTSDVNHMHALLTIPRDKMRAWKPNTGGIQNPTDSSKVFEFNPKRAHIRESNIALGNNGVLEVRDNTVIIRGNLEVTGDLKVAGSISCKKSLEVRSTVTANTKINTPRVSALIYDKIVPILKPSFGWTIQEFDDYDS